MLMKRGYLMATTTKPKPAIDRLLDEFGELLDEASAKMTKKELQESERKFNEALDRAAARKRRRETA